VAGTQCAVHGPSGRPARSRSRRPPSAAGGAPTANASIPTVVRDAVGAHRSCRRRSLACCDGSQHHRTVRSRLDREHREDHRRAVHRAVWYKYRCAAAKCPGHDQKNLDWEVGQAGRRWKTEYGEAGAREAMLKRWRDDMVSPDKDIHFYVGSQNWYRRTFSVLGTWYPKVEDVLF